MSETEGRPRSGTRNPARLTVSSRPPAPVIYMRRSSTRAATRRKLLAGESVRNGFAGFLNGTSGEVISFYEALKQDFPLPKKKEPVSGNGEAAES